MINSIEQLHFEHRKLYIFSSEKSKAIGKKALVDSRALLHAYSFSIEEDFFFATFDLNTRELPAGSCTQKL